MEDQQCTRYWCQPPSSAVIKGNEIPVLANISTEVGRLQSAFHLSLSSLMLAAALEVPAVIMGILQERAKGRPLSSGTPGLTPHPGTVPL